jgi:hypothetical protein
VLVPSGRIRASSLTPLRAASTVSPVLKVKSSMLVRPDATVSTGPGGSAGQDRDSQQGGFVGVADPHDSRVRDIQHPVALVQRQAVGQAVRRQRHDPGRLAVSRADLVARISTALNGFTATQHISPNHVIEFNASGPGRAICHSYMYAQHLLRGSGNGEFYLLRGSYTNHMLRTADGWRIERIIQHRSWEYGNTSAVTEAIARSHAQAPADQRTAST